MASKKELEGLNIIALAVLCGKAAANPTLDDATRDKAAKLKLEWAKLVQRETPPARDYKTHQKIQKEKAALKTRMAELLVTV